MGDLDKPRQRPSKLGLAGAALLASIGADQTDAGSDKVSSVRPQMQQGGSRERPMDDLAWFTERASTLEKISKAELTKIEGMVENGRVPLSLQVNFLGRSLKSGSIHHKELSGSDLTAERFSQIVKLVDRVSTRLTLAYAAKDAAPEVQKYFDVHALRAASRYIDLVEPTTKNTKFCNGFLTRYASDIYWGIAAHCVRGTTVEGEYTYGQNNADVAVKYIPQNDYERWYIDDPAELPEFSPTMTLDSASGQVVASFSWSPQGQEKVHFSFAMPFSPTARAHTYGANIDTEAPFFKSTMMFLKPHGEGEVVRKSPDGKVLATRGSGSSGSQVAAHIDGQYKTLSSFMGITILEDSCRKLCYAIAFGTTPDALGDTIKVERAQRVRASLSR